MITLIIFLAVMIAQSMAFEKILAKAKIDGIDTHDLDIYIEKKVRYLHVKIDIKPAVTGLMTLNKCVEQLAKSTHDLLEYSLYKSLHKRVTRIVERLARVTGKDYISRDKRSIEFLGDLISDIFGNPGPSDWKKVNSNILALENALKRIDENLGIDHGDIDSNRHVIEKHNKELKSLSEVVNCNQNDLVNINKEFYNLRTFFDISTLADTLDSLTLALVEISNQGMKGYCSDRAIDKGFLIENLQNMEANKAGISPIFGSWEWRNYFRHEMCTLAMVKEALWLTIRIPLVKRSERLVRAIPTYNMKSMIDRAELYGVKLVLFKEKDNDEFHVMSQANFDLCNVLGNTRTCATRDVRINSHSSVLAIEFLLDRFMIASNKLASVKVTEKCPNSVKEFNLKLDAVILTPVNCSYMSIDFSIDTRESDVEVLKEVGIISVDKLEINEIHNYHENVSRVFISEIANITSSRTFKENKAFIESSLDSINTKHESTWTAYTFDKWFIISGIVCLAVIILVIKLRSTLVTSRVRKSTFREIAELRNNLIITRNELRHEAISLQEINRKDNGTETESAILELEKSNAKFSSPVSRSQFL